MRPLKVSVIQTLLHWEDKAANLQMLAGKIAGIAATDLIVLPEMFTTGFSMNAERLAEDMDGPAVQWMRRMAADKNAVVTGSFIAAENGKYFNRLVWMQPNGEYELYDKRHLFGLSNEHEVFTQGQERIITELNGWKICPMVCYDLRFPAWSRNLDAAYDVLLYVANWPERRVQAWKYLLVARAIENQAYVIGVNRVGNDAQDIYHSGDSMVVDALGNVLYHQQHTEDVATIELSAEELQKTRESLPFLKDADYFEIDPPQKIKAH